MRANNVLGIIFSNAYDSALSEITSLRAMGSVPFCSRYRLIDFPLSSFVNSGISKVGIITKSNYQSLMDHLGTGKPWDLSRKRDGITFLPPFAGEKYENRINALEAMLPYISKSTNEYVLMAMGIVKERSSKNPDLPTGDIEIDVTDLRVLSKSETPPFDIVENCKTGENTRLKYRYLDLRRPDLQNNILFRHK